MSTIAVIKNTTTDCVKKPAMAAMIRLPHTNAWLSFFLAPTICLLPCCSIGPSIDFPVALPELLRDLLFRMLAGLGFIREPLHLALSMRAVALALPFPSQ